MLNNECADKIKDVLRILEELAETIQHMNFKNERYLHHYFSHLFQKRFDLLNLSKKDGKIMFHPEWPTYRKVKEMPIDWGKYSKDNEGYLQPDEEGETAHFDFAIGDYRHPSIGIEFKWEYGWDKTSLASDFVKCLDKQNDFDYTISYTVIFRKKKLPKKAESSSFHKKLNETYEKAVELLNDNLCGEDRGVYLIVTEIGGDNKRRHWYYYPQKAQFIVCPRFSNLLELSKKL